MQQKVEPAAKRQSRLQAIRIRLDELECEIDTAVRLRAALEDELEEMQQAHGRLLKAEAALKPARRQTRDRVPEATLTEDL
jgi:hypothetical protein